MALRRAARALSQRRHGADQAIRFHRLRQVDLDGNSVYSSIVTVGIDNSPSGVRVYSAGDILNISISPSLGASGAGVTVYDTRGRAIRRERLAAPGDFRIAGLPRQSLYFVVIGPDNGAKKTSAEVYIQ